MAGGIFGTPFVMNAKCILFALVQMLLLYTNFPSFKSKLMSYSFLFLVFVVAYVSMAWYDVHYGCDIEPLKRGEGLSITRFFKPPVKSGDSGDSGDSTGSQKVEKCSDHMMIIYLLHILFIAPFIYYIGYYGKSTPVKLFDILIPLAVFTALYHIYRLFITQKSAIPDESESELSN